MSVSMYTSGPAMGGALFAVAPPVFRALGWAEPVPPGWGMAVCYSISALYIVLATAGCFTLRLSGIMRLSMVCVAAGTIPAAWFWWSHDAWLLAGLNGVESALAVLLTIVAGRLFRESE